LLPSCFVGLNFRELNFRELNFREEVVVPLRQIRLPSLQAFFVLEAGLAVVMEIS